ncbi:MAG: molybdenum cofactor biosynthesis protein MoaE [Pyrodictiaceae archaeon]
MEGADRQRYLIGSEDIDLNKLVKEIAARTAPKGAGAIVLFVGFVKGIVEGKKVQELEYMAYEPYANKKISEILKEATEDPEVLEAIVYHKLGKFKPGETTVYVVVSATTRHKAFEKAAWILERVKHETPIYKLERRSDGEYWVVGDNRRIPHQPRRKT